MKIDEIKAEANKRGIKFIEFEDISLPYNACCVKYLDDFLDISGDIVGYSVDILDEYESTERTVKIILGQLRRDFSSYLEDEMEDELYEICKTPAGENIILLSIQNNFVYKEYNKLDAGGFEKVLKRLTSIEEKYKKELLEAKEQRDKNITKTIDDYKEKYKKANLVKDKESVIKELSVKLSTEYGIDGRNSPQYSQNMLKLRLED